MPELRDIIEIDEELCDGCGQCVPSCAEGALRIVDGKARLVAEVYCDGLGACLGECPTGALKIVQRKAEAFDEEAVEERLTALKEMEATPPPMACGCPSTQEQVFAPAQGPAPAAQPGAASRLGHWPVKLQLVSPQSPFIQGADLLLLADCAACAVPELHDRYLNGKAVVMACPKLDDAQAHADKLAQVLAQGRPRSLTVLHMDVPCCKGLEWVARQAMDKAGVDLPVRSVTVGRQGQEMDQDRSLPVA